MKSFQRKCLLLSTFTCLSVLQACSTANFGSWFTYDYVPSQGKTGTIQDIEMSAINGDARSQYTLANNYYRGIGVARNDALARKWMVRAANQGYAPAKTALTGMMHPQYIPAGNQPEGKSGRVSTGPVVLENGYYVGSGSVQNPRDHDANWIARQNPQSYTIEVESDYKPSTVARTLQGAPQVGHKAQFSYATTSGKRYSGVIGTYASREEAEKALQNMPSEIRATAKLRQWDTVQRDVRRIPKSDMPQPEQAVAAAPEETVTPDQDSSAAGAGADASGTAAGTGSETGAANQGTTQSDGAAQGQTQGNMTSGSTSNGGNGTGGSASSSSGATTTSVGNTVSSTGIPAPARQ